MANIKDYSEQLSSLDSNFVLEAVKEGVRIDGRAIFQQRNLTFSFGRVNGKSRVEVCFGKTRVMSVVSAEVVSPFPDRPTEGFLDISTTISPMASPSVEVGRNTDLSVEISKIVDKAVKDTKAIDLEALCIVAGNKSWNVRCDITVLEYDGNTIDPAMLSAIAALLHFRKPDVTVIGEDVTIHPLSERDPVPLAIHFIPMCVTFAFFDEDLLVVDPNEREELTAKGQGTFVLNSHREVCGVHKHGEPGVPAESLIKCVKIAAKRYKEVVGELNKQLEQAELLAREKVLQQALQYSSMMESVKRNQEEEATE